MIPPFGALSKLVVANAGVESNSRRGDARRVSMLQCVNRIERPIDAATGVN
jgi:hypothetical protein